MGLKSDAEILEGLSAHRAASAGETEASEPQEGVGETIEEPGDGDDSDAEPDEDGDDSEEETDESEDGEETDEEEPEDDEPEEETEDDSDEEPEEEGPSSADAEIARIQEAEKAAKQRIGEQLQEVETKLAESRQLEQEAKQAKAEAEKIKADAERAAKQSLSTPITAFKKFGAETPDDFKRIGRQLFRYGKGISADAAPEDKNWAEAQDRDGEQSTSIEDVKARLAKYEEREAEAEKRKEEEAKAQKEQAEAKAMLSEFFDSVVAEAENDFPVAANILADADDEVRESVLELAAHMARKAGAPPTAAQLLEEIETQERKRLQRLKLNPDELFPRKKTKTKDKPGSASKKEKAPVKKNKQRQKTGKEKKSHQKTDAEILADLRKMKEARKSA